jgi:sigma-54 dependent transcriptional regulator, acetoin dehydrogenase operon transcriptional activator AcoR
MVRHLAQVRPAMEDVYQFVEGSHCVIACTDADARLVDVIADPELLAELRGIGFVRGACWSEECAGTNGLALALLESFPTQVCGAAHYGGFLAPYCTSAAPVYDSLGGLVGGLAAVTRATEAHVHTLGMMSAAANALTSELRMNLWLGSANELLTEMNAILQTLSEGILLLTGDGTLAQMNARAGQLLGLAPARVTGRRLADVVEMPASLSEALQQGRELHDEEVVFRARGERIAYICTLRAITAPASLQAMAPLTGKGQPGAGLSVSPQAVAGGFVLTLRSVERVQRLVHRMSGAHALMRFNNIVGQSPQLLEAVRLAGIAAESASTVLLRGETGTGKEVFAQSIHNGSARATGPFVAINCAAIPRELISSELFGYEGGAFTGADRQGRPGKFELANRGTLFLDEIGDMPRDLQTSLLRAIETHTIVRVGGQHVTPVDVRIIAATHRDLAEEARVGNFRSDLFFRLNVFPIEVPALRERTGDIALLLAHVLQRLSTRLNRTLGIETETLAALEAYRWPGNVRELENVIERAVYVSERGMIRPTDLPEHIQSAVLDGVPRSAWKSQFGAVGAAPQSAFEAIHPTTPVNPRHTLRRESDNAEAALITHVLQTCGGNMTQAAAALGINRTTLWRKKRRYQL